MNGGRDSASPVFADIAARVSLGWLVFGCVLGLVCAGGLVFPALGAPALAGYGRLMVVHLNVQLYGWCFLPLLSLLAAKLFAPHEHRERIAVLALWSAALAAGVLHWLWGGAAGKVFLDWRGFSLGALVSTLSLIWFFAARSVACRRHESGFPLRVATLAGLAVSGVGFVVACDPHFLPPVNPHSGGATGHNLLASTLGFAVLVTIIPMLLFPAVSRRGFRAWSLYAVLALGGVVHTVIPHGDASHLAPAQVAGLAFTPVLGAALAFRLSDYPWRSRTAFLWFSAWWMITALDGLLIFLPGILETAKFSNALVAHAHWAMAGMVTALNLLILENLPAARIRFGDISQAVWHGANFIMGLALSMHALREPEGALWRAHDGWTGAAYGIRFLAGAVMVCVAALWFLGACGVDPASARRSWRAWWPVALLASFGLCDAATGVFLATMPNETLAWMLIPDAAALPPGPVGLIGAFVGVVGCSYLVQAVLFQKISDLPAGTARATLRGAFLALYGLSAAVRVVVAAYGFAAVLDARWSPWWLTVPLADAAIAGTQWALRRQLIPDARD